MTSDSEEIGFIEISRQIQLILFDFMIKLLLIIPFVIFYILTSNNSYTDTLKYCIIFILICLFYRIIHYTLFLFFIKRFISRISK